MLSASTTSKTIRRTLAVAGVIVSMAAPATALADTAPSSTSTAQSSSQHQPALPDRTTLGPRGRS